MAKLLVLLFLSLVSLSQCTWWSEYVCAVFPPNNSSTDKAPALELKNLPPGQSSSAKVVSKPPSVVGLMVYKAAAPAVTQNTATGSICPMNSEPTEPTAFRAHQSDSSNDDSDTNSDDSDVDIQSVNGEPSKFDQLIPLTEHVKKIFEKYVKNNAEMQELVQQKTEEWREAGEKEALVKVANFYAGTVEALQKCLEERDAIIVDWEKTNEEQKRTIKKKATTSGLLILDVEKLIAMNKQILKELSGVVKDRRALENELKIHALLVDILKEKNTKANAEIEKLQNDDKTKDAKHVKDLAAKDAQHAKVLKDRDDEHARQLSAEREWSTNTIANLRAELEKANKSWFKDTCKWFSDYLNLLGSALVGYGDKLAASKVGISIYKLAERAELALKGVGIKAKGGFKAYISKPFLATLESHSRLIEQYYSQPIIGNRQYGHLTVNPVRLH